MSIHTNKTPDENGQEGFERRDKVYPVVDRVGGSADVYVEQGRIRMREERNCMLSVGCANRTIDDPSPVATIHAGIGDAIEDEVYAELALDDLDRVKQLRDALDRVIQYREGPEQ